MRPPISGGPRSANINGPNYPNQMNASQYQDVRRSNGAPVPHQLRTPQSYPQQYQQGITVIE
jgi:hypothetical protein